MQIIPVYKDKLRAPSTLCSANWLWMVWSHWLDHIECIRDGMFLLAGVKVNIAPFPVLCATASRLQLSVPKKSMKVNSAQWAAKSGDHCTVYWLAKRKLKEMTACWSRLEAFSVDPGFSDWWLESPTRGSPNLFLQHQVHVLMLTAWLASCLPVFWVMNTHYHRLQVESYFLSRMYRTCVLVGSWLECNQAQLFGRDPVDLNWVVMWVWCVWAFNCHSIACLHNV